MFFPLSAKKDNEDDDASSKKKQQQRSTSGNDSSDDKKRNTNKKKGGNKRVSTGGGKRTTTNKRRSSSSSSSSEEIKAQLKANLARGRKKDAAAAIGRSSKSNKETKNKGGGGSGKLLRQPSSDEEEEDVPSNSNSRTPFLKSIRQTLQTISDPYEAGYQFRRTLNSAITTFTRTPGGSSSSTLNEYYLDDRLFALESNLRNYDPDYVPEILVVGATTKIGQLVVQKLLLRGMRVRVLVPNLYSSTLNLFRGATQVIYCQGDLSNVESLEYALTEVDKIVFCAHDIPAATAAATVETGETNDDNNNNGGLIGAKTNTAAVAAAVASEGVRNANAAATTTTTTTAEDIDVRGMANVLHAYQNVRFADYGAGQAAKRSLFKFQDRPEDFDLFDIDDDYRQEEMEEEREGEDDDERLVEQRSDVAAGGSRKKPTSRSGGRGGGVNAAQWCRWMKNKNGHGVFIGQVGSGFTGNAAGGEASIASARLRARKKKIKKTKTKEKVSSSSSVKAAGGEEEGGTGGAGDAEADADSDASTPQKKEGGDDVSGDAVQEDDEEEEEAWFEDGIDLSRGFAGFVCRLCGDGKVYEAFVRTGEYERKGIEYVQEFRTITKPSEDDSRRGAAAGDEDSSSLDAGGGEETEGGTGGGVVEKKEPRSGQVPKFTSVRLPFSEFRPVKVTRAVRDDGTEESSSSSVLEEELDDDVEPFIGKDVRQIGFRFRSAPNEGGTTTTTLDKLRSLSVAGGMTTTTNSPPRFLRFYLALSYMKLYRSNPEPEFVYLSDANIPPVVLPSMVRRDTREILSKPPTTREGEDGVGEGIRILEDSNDGTMTTTTTSTGGLLKSLGNEKKEATYFRYQGEQLLRNSGLSYSIVRVSEFSEAPSSDLSTLSLRQSNKDLVAVSRADAAEVCVSSLLDSNACNVALYLTKSSNGAYSSPTSFQEDLSSKFSRLKANS